MTPPTMPAVGQKEMPYAPNRSGPKLSGFGCFPSAKH